MVVLLQWWKKQIERTQFSIRNATRCKGKAQCKRATVFALLTPNDHISELSNEVYYVFLAQLIPELQAVLVRKFVVLNLMACNSKTT